MFQQLVGLENNEAYSIISQLIAYIPDEACEKIHRRGLVRFDDLPKEFNTLHANLDISLHWQSVAVFTYACIEDEAIMQKNPFELEEYERSLYGLVLVRNATVVVAFKESDRKVTPLLCHFEADMGLYESVRLYDHWPQDERMSYIRHFFGIPDGYSFVSNKLLYRVTLGLLNPKDWLMWAKAPCLHTAILNAALSCQQELFELFDLILQQVPEFRVTVCGYSADAGIAALTTCLLFQKMREANFDPSKVILSVACVDIPDIFNSTSSNIFTEKVGDEQYENYFTPKNEQWRQSIVNAFNETFPDEPTITLDDLIDDEDQDEDDEAQEQEIDKGIELEQIRTEEQV